MPPRRSIAIEEIDRLRESGPGPEEVFFLNGIRLMPPTNPAAQILPIVERVAPERLADVFWRAVALHPRIETDREDQLQSSYIGYECTLSRGTTARSRRCSSSR